MTVSLPPRVDAGRLFFWVWGLASALVYGMSALTGMPAGGVFAVICGAVVGLLAGPAARWMPLRLHRTPRRKNDGSGIALSGGVLFVLIVSVGLARVASRNYIGSLDAFVPLLAAIVTALAAMIPLGVWLSEHTGTVSLTATALQVGRRRWLLEDIAEVESHKDGSLRVDGETVAALLQRREREWLREQIRDAIRTRQQALAEAGHDLSVRGSPPEALQALRGQGEQR